MTIHDYPFLEPVILLLTKTAKKSTYIQSEQSSYLLHPKIKEKIKKKRPKSLESISPKNADNNHGIDSIRDFFSAFPWNRINNYGQWKFVRVRIDWQEKKMWRGGEKRSRVYAKDNSYSQSWILTHCPVDIARYDNVRFIDTPIKITKKKLITKKKPKNTIHKFTYYICI